MKKHNIELSNDELLVLHELLIRVNEENLLDNNLIDQSEQAVLWNLECICEKKNSTVFTPNYLEAVQKARDTLRHED